MIGNLSPLAPNILCLAVALSFGSSVASANDGAASVALGGIQLKREVRVSMEKERLTITENKITVEYEFLNETNEDIMTEVAFPVPPYDFFFDNDQGYLGVDSFRVWVDGAEIKPGVEVKAFNNGIDQTRILQELGIDIPSFAHFDAKARNLGKSELTALPPEVQARLIDLGLMDAETKFPDWTVHKTYHWPQNFPSHNILQVRHEYRPIEGYEQTQLVELEPEITNRQTAEIRERVRQSPGDLFTRRFLETGCVDSATRRKIVSYKSPDPTPQSSGDKWVGTSWIQYILTTANTWKTPIKDFELIVERPLSQSRAPIYVSFCWDGPVTRDDENHFLAKVRNFVPRKELTVMFLQPNW